VCFVARYLPKKVDIGLGPLPMINNIYWAKALRKKGYLVETYVNDLYFITDDFDFVCTRTSHKLYFRFPILLFLRCALRYSCIYIYFNGGPLQNSMIYRSLEPYLFKLAKVKVVVMPYGSDSHIFERTRNKVVVNELCKDYPDFFQMNHSKIINQVERWSKNSDIVIGTMDSIDYLFFWNRVIPCHFAIDTDSIKPEKRRIDDKREKIKILHAPNHTNIKGTSFVEEAINRIKNEGYEIEYLRIQRLSNQEVIQKIMEADIVVDQLIIGWYAMFAMEAMACGKTCICFLRDDLIETYIKIGCLKKDEIPLINANTSNIYDVLKDLITNKDKLDVIGNKSREYVVTHHSLEAIGNFYEEINESIGLEKHGICK